MKKKIVMLIAVMLLSLSIFSGCGSNGEYAQDNLLKLCYDDTSGDKNVLMYNPDTKIVYIFNQNTHLGGLCPYISENGKYVRWIDESLVEVK